MEMPRFKILAPPESRNTETQLVETPPPVPTELSPKVAKALAQRVEREQMSMAGSWGREAAKNTMQASLDIHRALQTARIALTVQDEMRGRLAELWDKTESAVEMHPDLEIDFREMQSDTARILKQLNNVTAVGYLRRYHRLGPEDSDR